jgi:hypothetical protein
MNAIYAVTGTAAGGYNVTTLNFYLSSGYTYTAGSKWDVVLVLAPTPTTQATSALRSTTYTTVGTSADTGWRLLNVAECGILPMSTPYWVGVVENEPGPIGQGYSNCGCSCAGGVRCRAMPAARHLPYLRSQRQVERQAITLELIEEADFFQHFLAHFDIAEFRGMR